GISCAVEGTGIGDLGINVAITFAFKESCLDRISQPERGVVISWVDRGAVDEDLGFSRYFGGFLFLAIRLRVQNVFDKLHFTVQENSGEAFAEEKGQFFL